jgi:uncharacterized SAM-binding protein YcdF (DUF218 family)
VPPAVFGMAVGFLLTQTAGQLGLLLVPWKYAYFLGVALGGLAALTRLRRWMWAGGALLAFATFVVAFTPVMPPHVRGLVRSDPLEPCDAVVVLSTTIWKDGGLTSTSQERLIRGYEVLRQGLAPRLVVTRLGLRQRSYVPTVRRQMERLGLDYPIDEAGEVVSDTHDEALAVKELADRRGWRRIILVSSPTHLRRAGAVFRKTGLEVLCSPCNEGSFDIESLADPNERLAAFRSWLHEVVGYEVYRLRGWL